MNEYELLRAEELDNINSYLQYHTLLYTSTAAILAFTFEKGHPILCLLPYIVIVPVYLSIQQKRASENFITSYLIVFWDKTDYRWEKRLHDLWSKNRGNTSSKRGGFFSVTSHLPSLVTTLICPILATYKTILYNAQSLEKGVLLALIWIITIIVIAIMACNFIRPDHKDLCIKQWQELKAAEEEEAQKRKNNTRNPQ